MVHLQQDLAERDRELKEAKLIPGLLYKYLCDTSTPGVEKPKRLAGGFSSLPRPSGVNVNMCVNALVSGDWSELREGKVKKRWRKLSLAQDAVDADDLKRIGVTTPTSAAGASAAGSPSPSSRSRKSRRRPSAASVASVASARSAATASTRGSRASRTSRGTAGTRGSRARSKRTARPPRPPK